MISAGDQWKWGNCGICWELPESDRTAQRETWGLRPTLLPVWRCSSTVLGKYSWPTAWLEQCSQIYDAALPSCLHPTFSSCHRTSAVSHFSSELHRDATLRDENGRRVSKSLQPSAIIALYFLNKPGEIMIDESAISHPLGKVHLS